MLPVPVLQEQFPVSVRVLQPEQQAGLPVQVAQVRVLQPEQQAGLPVQVVQVRELPVVPVRKLVQPVAVLPAETRIRQ
ncbi:hypothetical protein FACS189427_10860 [Planctomycetales bacterium]|nr:hypothetical protein FACS189427_10860 [Planctomycetales bacterium]